MIKVCVLGASGFVGRALIERLINRNDIELVAVIHSPGNAWPILRFNIPLIQADMSDVESLEKAITGCTHVINLSLGSFEKMAGDISNLVKVCKKLYVKRLIHLSSITVYGDFPHGDSEFENGPMLAKKKTYGWYKNQQDNIIKKANKNGLSSIVLCPPHITGAYGRIFHQVIDSIKNNTFALVDNGDLPCNIVDVNNLCKAIELSLFVAETDGKRIFITNGDNYFWRDMAMDAAKIAGKEFDKIPRITSLQALRLKNDKLSLVDFFKALFRQPEARQLIGRTIIVNNKIIFSSVKKVLSFFHKNRAIRNENIQGSNIDLLKINSSLCKQQLRGVRHKIDKAKQSIGYEPTISSVESFKIFEDYYKTLYGYNSEYWELIN